jgi:pSer/pThr/pTyr-binding forkhead associated (FHA) protein
MSQLSVTLLRLGYLILLWGMVLVAIGVLRSDLYGTRVTSRGKGLRRKPRPDARTQKSAAPTRASVGVRPGSVSTRNPAVAHLAIISGSLKGTTLPLGETSILIGRASTCTIVIEDDFLSARHCRIFPEHGQWFVEDLGSTNGTFLGNQRIDDPVPFGIGERVRIGSTTLELRS